LVNLHLAAVVPGWSLSAAFLARHLERDETEGVTDPWVRERATLLAVDGDRLLAAAHLLRYADRPDVGAEFRGLGEIGWALAPPAEGDALAALLAAARARFGDWNVAQESGWGAGLPAGPFGGVPDVWPHVAAALEAAGYRPAPGRREALWGGGLDDVPTAGAAPVAGLTLGRAVGAWGTRLAALLDGAEVGHAEAVADLTVGGALPAPLGWAELQELWVDEAWRNRGVGRWLVAHAAAWLRLGGATRIVLSVAAEDEAAGAGRFYRRCDWSPFVRAARSWLPAEPDRPPHHPR
jgi:GNAT superfamily N-acetyltransferase